MLNSSHLFEVKFETFCSGMHRKPNFPFGIVFFFPCIFGLLLLFLLLSFCLVVCRPFRLPLFTGKLGVNVLIIVEMNITERQPREETGREAMFFFPILLATNSLQKKFQSVTQAYSEKENPSLCH